MTKEDIKQICQIYDNFRSERDAATITYNSDDTFWEHILATYNLSQPSLPTDLDEAAEEASQSAYSEPTAAGFAKRSFFKRGFKAGADWMAGQGCTVEIDEGYFINNPQHDRREGKFHKYYSSVFGHSKKIVVTPGDEVVVQIRKK